MGPVFGQSLGESLDHYVTVCSVGAESHRLSQLHAQYVSMCKSATPRHVVMAFAAGLSSFVTYGIYALAFSYGSDLVSRGEMEVGGLVTALLACMIAGMSVARLSGECSFLWDDPSCSFIC